MTTGETTSHPTKQPKDGCQVAGYSNCFDLPLRYISAIDGIAPRTGFLADRQAGIFEKVARHALLMTCIFMT
jgi:hypothetical protein